MSKRIVKKLGQNVPAFLFIIVLNARYSLFR